jgi:hypothetical protein
MDRTWLRRSSIFSLSFLRTRYIIEVARSRHRANTPLPDLPSCERQTD